MSAVFNRPAPAAMLLIAIIGLVVAQTLDGLLTSTGIVLLGIALPLPLIGQWGLAAGFALVMQCAAIGGELALTTGTHGSGRLFTAGRMGFALFVLIVIQGAGAAVHFIQVLNTSEGERLERTLAYDVQGLAQRTMAVDQQVREAYRRGISEQRRLGDQSAAGLDETRDKRCGPLCQQAYRTARELQGRYADIDLPITVPPARDTSSESVEANYIKLAVAVAALRDKAARYMEMCSTLRWTCSDPARAVLDDPSYQRVVQAFSGTRLADRQTLVLEHAATEVKAASRGDISMHSAFLMLFVLLLPFCELALVTWIGCAIHALRRSPADELAMAKQEEALLDAQLSIASRMAAKRAFKNTFAATL